MATAYGRYESGAFEVIGEAVMHTSDWQASGYYEGEDFYVPGDSMQGQKVTVMRGADGALHVVPTAEINEHFQVVE